MSRESTRRQFLAAGTAAGAVALAGCGGGGGGGSAGGNGTVDWYYADSNETLSKELVAIVNDKDNQDIKLRQGGTPVEAIKHLHKRLGEFAVVGADVVSFAKEGAGLQSINKKYNTIRSVMALYPMPLTIVARPDLEADTLSEVSDATINVGKPSSRLAVNSQQVLNNSTAEFSMANLSVSDAMSKLSEGSLDVTFAMGTWPIPEVQEVAPDIKILGVSEKTQSKVLNSTNWFVESTLPAGVYDGVDHMVPTPGIMALLITRKRVNQQIVAVVTSRIIESSSKGKIKTFSGYIATKDTIQMARRGIPKTIPMHDGAEEVIVYNN